MSNYVLNFAGTGATSEIVADTDTDAISQAEELLGADVVSAEQWDADGTNDEGQRMERLLFWASEADAQNDPGARAIAQLTVVRP